MKLYLGDKPIADCEPIELKLPNGKYFSDIFQCYMKRGENYYFRNRWGTIIASFGEKLDIKMGEFYRLKGNVSE